MARLTSVEPEVIGCRDQASPEVMMPNSVHHDSSEQWIAFVCDPLGKFLATICIWRIRLQTEISIRPDDGRDSTSGNGFAFGRGISSIEQISRFWSSRRHAIDAVRFELSLLLQQASNFLNELVAVCFFNSGQFRNDHSMRRLADIGCVNFFWCQSSIVKLSTIKQALKLSIGTWSSVPRATVSTDLRRRRQRQRRRRSGRNLKRVTQ